MNTAKRKDEPGPKKPLTVGDLFAQLRKFVDAINHETPLACVLISTSFLEQCLATLIHNFMVDCTTADTLCSYAGGVASDLAKKAKLAYCCGLIPRGMFQNLEKIGDVRNRFAHAHFEIDFTDRVVADKCGELLAHRPDVEVTDLDRNAEQDFNEIGRDARGRFITVVTQMAAHTLMVAKGVTHRVQAEDTWNVRFVNDDSEQDNRPLGTSGNAGSLPPQK